MIRMCTNGPDHVQFNKPDKYMLTDNTFFSDMWRKYQTDKPQMTGGKIPKNKHKESRNLGINLCKIKKLM